MQLVYGGFAHAVNEGTIVTNKEIIRSAAELPYAVKETWNITGFAQAANQNALIGRLTAMEAAYSRDYQTIALLANDGSVARFMKGLTRVGGVLIKGGVSYPDGGANDAEFSTYRRFSITVEGTYNITEANVILSWTELLTFTGGGPKFVYLVPILGKPLRQQVNEFTPNTVTQQGEASALYAYPNPALPIWPDAEHVERRRITPKSPKRGGGSQAPFYYEYPVSWSYEFESADDLIGTPTKQK